MSATTELTFINLTYSRITFSEFVEYETLKWINKTGRLYFP